MYDCKICGLESENPNLFVTDTRCVNGKRHQCKDCARPAAATAKKRFRSKPQNREKERIESLAWYHANKRKAYFTRLLRQYGLTEAGFNVLLQAQDNGCAICHESFDQCKPCVDHCHETNEVRGLLCDSCNVGLGKFKDSCKLLEKAAEYILLGEMNGFKIKTNGSLVRCTVDPCRLEQGMD